MKKIALTIASLFLLCATESRGASPPQDIEGWLVTSTHIALDDQRTYQVYL